ncbi:26S proteasome non-ATPase regulatory subunit 5 [Anastrepha ludens]|uniref:26S proteasome non-ATPase regulatory subunit 5 n=1 Tax=Anastrepha ludens TaxID=28586 RepID=UPI0023B1F60B|nr:26S proteasome non-ATPase regulatory subunit 5 [Anastrepha ludens]
MSESWFCEQIENLKIQENRMSTLSEIRVRLSQLDGSSNSQLEAHVANCLLNAPEIYECLNESSECDQQCEIATDILSMCMSNMHIGQNNMPVYLERALTHPRPRIQAIVFKTILKQLEREQTQSTESDISDELLNLVLKGLQHEDTEVGVPVVEILSIVLKSRLDQIAIKQKLLDVLSCSEIIKCRVYELAVNLAKQSPSMLKQVEFLLDRALSELDNDDVLFQVNILEILVSLAEQNHGLLYLEDRQVFEIISRRVENVEQNPIDHLLIPGIMKFFGKAASVQPQKVIVGYPHMIQCFFQSILSGDVSILPAAFDTFANLALSKKGKLLLDQNYPAMIKETFEEIASYLRNLSTDLKNRAFNTLEIIFTTESVSQADIDELLRKWFVYLADGENMQFLMDFCRNPFPDIKVACLSFIKSVCRHRWGVVALKDTAGFVEYLLDRKIEFDKEAKYKKFELISLLADSDVFDVQTNIQLRTYANEGPYFIQSIMDIATEGN